MECWTVDNCRRTTDATLWAARGQAHGRTVHTKRRVRSCPRVHRAFPKVSKHCRAKRALTLHYQPRFRRNQSISTHNSAALRAQPRYRATPQILWVYLGTKVPASAVCLGPDQKPHVPPRSPLIILRARPRPNLLVSTSSAARSAGLHFYLIDFDLPQSKGRRRLIILPALSCPCRALPCIALPVCFCGAVLC